MVVLKFKTAYLDPDGNIECKAYPRNFKIKRSDPPNQQLFPKELNNTKKKVGRRGICHNNFHFDLYFVLQVLEQNLTD